MPRPHRHLKRTVQSYSPRGANMTSHVRDHNIMYDAGKEDYLRPSEHIGLDWTLLND